MIELFVGSLMIVTIVLGLQKKAVADAYAEAEAQRNAHAEIKSASFRIYT